VSDVSALVFDLDQTLLDRQAAFDDWMASLDVTSFERKRLRELDDNGDGERELFFDAVASLIGEPLSQQSFVESLLRFAKPDHALVRTLKRLQANYVLAILTNGGALSQQTKIDSLGLCDVFAPNCIFVSSVIGFEKPDPNAFYHVAEAIGVANETCLYFGDRIETDIFAAKRAGWRACHVAGPDDLKQRLLRLHEAAIC
jgi:putative hydrolase of the HAD superfamily